MGIYMVKTARHVPVSYTHLDVYKRQDFGMLMHKCMYLTLFFPDVITMKS